MKLSQKGFAHLLLLIILLGGLIAGVYLVAYGDPLKLFSRAFEKKFNFYGKQVNVLKVFGQSKLSETSRNIVTGNAIYHAGGVVVDKSHPYEADKVYVVDGGNNRVLGFNGIGTCSNDRRACTADKNCNGGTCRINTSKNADIVIGQPDFQSGACNLDNNLGIFKRPGPDTLCLMAYPVAANTAESWTRSNFDVDNEGNLYITDASNNRVLKYNQPLGMDRSGGRGDAVADFVIGQQDFNSNGINGSQLVSHRLGQVLPPNRNSLYLSGGDFGATTTGGVSIDKEGSVWIADIFNNRVLRFPKGSKEADLVIGQTDFTTRGSINCFDGSSPNPGNIPLDRLCVPAVAKVNPDTGDLYVLDEYSSPFIARILLFKPPFTNGMRASKIIIPGSGPSMGELGNKYLFQSSGFAFNNFKEGEYARGILWVNEHQTDRTILIDNDGNVIKTIGIVKFDLRGGDTQYGGECGNIADSNEFNLWWPGGSIGFDSDNNIYLADEFFKRISRYSLPYNFRRVGNSYCLPKAAGGLLKGFSANVEGDSKLGESVGLVLYKNQLIVRDENQRFKVWNNYQNKSILNPTPDIVIKGQLATRNLLSDSVDPFGRLWLFNEHGQIMIYQLPFRGNDQPIKNFVKLYWSDTKEEIPYRGSGSISFDRGSGGIYITDTRNNRILRSTRWIELFNDPSNRLYIDAVIGQPDKQTISCNQGKGKDLPSAAGLCVPTQVKFDKSGNMYVVENTYECNGNNRISVFKAEDLVNNRNSFPNLSAKHVFVRKSLTQTASCSATDKLNEPSSPVSIAFNSKNQMVVANDGSYGGYYGENPDKRYKRQLWFYRDPFRQTMPDAFIDLPMGAPGEIAFDDQDNLLIQDHTWYRIWMVNLDKDPLWLNALPAPVLSEDPLIQPTPIPTPIGIGTTAPAFSRVFVTSTTYNGNLGGLDGADSKCQERADVANLGGSWKAWLSDTTTSAKDRIYQSTNPYKLLNGGVIANNWTQLTSGTLLGAINITELNNTIALYGTVWTNTFTSGQRATSFVTGACNSWTSTNGSGQAGLVTSDGRWSQITDIPCSNALPLYCFEQISQVSPSSSPVASPSPSLGSWCSSCGADFNKDGIVDSNDFAKLSECWGKKPNDQDKSGYSCGRYDLDNDGVVSAPDGICVTNNKGQTCPIVSQSIPIGYSNNLIGLTIDKGGAYFAEDFLKDLNKVTPGNNKIYRIYKTDPATNRNITHNLGTTNDNFPIKPGEGYFVVSNRWKGTVSISGTNPQQTTITIPKGNSLISFWQVPSNINKAEVLLQAMKAQAIQVSQIAKYQYGGYQGHPIGYPFNNFDIQTGRGYSIKNMGEAKNFQF